MKAVIQRVAKASVVVDDKVISSIGQGLCVLVGISRDDNPKDMEYIVRKILNTRMFDDDNNKRWAKSVMDKQYEVLCVSQFTLYHILKGNKPDFHQAMGGDESQRFYHEFLKQMKASYKPEMIKDGVFGAYMQVNIQNDGPVTITIESPHQEVKEKKNQRQQKGQKSEKLLHTNNQESSSSQQENCTHQETNNPCVENNSTDLSGASSCTTDSVISEKTESALKLDQS